MCIVQSDQAYQGQLECDDGVLSLLLRCYSLCCCEHSGYCGTAAAPAITAAATGITAAARNVANSK